MAEKRLTRGRALSSRPTGGASAALGRRNGKPAPKLDVVPFFGEDGDTPLTEMLKAVKPTTQSYRGGEYTHVSDVISKCVRKIALMRRMDMRHPQESLMEGQAITFAIGDSLHDYVKARFIKGHPSKVWAKWTCPCGDTHHTGTFSSRPKKECGSCGLPVDKHNEVSFIDEEYKLKGTPDLLLWLEEYAAFYVTELKSMSAAQFNELVRPIPDHMVQLAFYWNILKRAGKPVVDRVSLLYVNKEFSFKFPYKEFMFDPAAVDLGVYWEDLENLKIAEAGGELPPRIICGSPTAPDAKKCAVCVTCFGS